LSGPLSLLEEAAALEAISLFSIALVSLAISASSFAFSSALAYASDLLRNTILSLAAFYFSSSKASV